MIKHLILDMGNVMLQFVPELFIRDLGITDPEIHSLLRREVFQSLEWSLLDWGMMDEAAAAAASGVFEPHAHRLMERMTGKIR